MGETNIFRCAPFRGKNCDHENGEGEVILKFKRASLPLSLLRKLGSLRIVMPFKMGQKVWTGNLKTQVKPNKKKNFCQGNFEAELKYF